MDEKVCVKNLVFYICAALAIVAILAIGAFLRWQDIRHEALHENTSTNAIVIDKYTSEHNGTYFWVVAEHEAVTSTGDKTSVTREYSVPWEDYIEIETGDTITTNYTKPGLWWYVSYEKAIVEDG